MRYDWRNNSVLFVHNLAADPREVEFSTGLKGESGKRLVNLLTDDHSQAGDEREALRLPRRPTAIAGIASAAWTIC